MAGVLFIIGSLILVGFIGNLLFRKTHIPESLFLILAGFLLGPVLGLMSSQSLLGLADVFTTFALIIVLLEGGVHLDIFGIVRNIGKSSLFTLLSVILSLVSASFILIFSGVSPLTAFAFGIAVAGTTSITVLHILKRVGLPSSIKEVLAMESVLTDVFLITAALIMMQILSLGNVSLNSVLSTIFAEVSVAFFTGVVSFLIWAYFNSALKRHRLLYISTLGMLLILYDLTEYVGGNGPISVLTFSLLLGNMSRLGRKIKGKSIFSSIKESLIRELRSVEREFSFFIKTFFFVYIGMIAQIDLYILLMSAAVTLVLFSSKLVSSLVFGHLDKSFRKNVVRIAFIIPRGFSSILISIMLSSAGIIGEKFVGMAVGVVFLSTLVSMLAR